MPKAQPKVGNGAWPLACALTLLVWLLARIVADALRGGLNPDPDAAYGLIIARNLVERGLVTFDGQTLTSGFSPSWVGLLALQRLTLGPNLAFTFIVEAVLLTAALWILLRVSPVRSRFFQAAFTAAFAWIAAGMGLLGLETSLLAFGLSVFVAALVWRTESLLGGWALGFAALLCIATRIEAAFFVVPALMLAPTRVANRVTGLLLLTLGALGYGAADLIKFGAALPMTSQVRSLGGLQFNTALIDQGFEAFAIDGYGARLLIAGAALAIAPLFIPLTRTETPARALGIAAAVGGWLFLARLLLFSSWRVGPSQEFGVLFPLLTAYFVIAPARAAGLAKLHGWMGQPRLLQPASASLAGLVLAVLLGQSALAATDNMPPPAQAKAQADEAAALIARLVDQYGARFDRGRMAMGDGAGLLAVSYAGPVSGLEGQASDLAYLKILEAGGDITPLLCARGVRYFAALQPDMGRYGRAKLAVLDPAKTTHAGPTVDIDSRDEVAHLTAPRAQARGLYVWRLGACWRNGYAALPDHRLFR